MDYKKKYKEALEELKQCDRYDIEPAKTILKIFPELEESDYIIKQRLRHLLGYFRSRGIDHDLCNRILNWLEKQGEQNYKIIKGKNYFCVKTHNYAGVEWIKGTKYYASDNYTLVNQGCEYYCPEYSKEEHNNLFEEVKYNGCVEKQGEQNSTPKFKVGDWVVFNNNHYSVYQIEKIENYEYTLRHILGGSMCLSFSHENMIRAWTIEDAKDSDVLAIGNEYFLFKQKKDTSSSVYISHCFADSAGAFRVTNGRDCGEFLSIENGIKACPATKEQRDFLFQKMKEAGYEWDVNKKELNKIEKNSTWSEEDEEMMKQIDSLLYCQCTIHSIMYEKLHNWLKSLKNRVQPHWKPTEEQIEDLKYAINMVDKCCEDSLQSLYNDLKNFEI